MVCDGTLRFVLALTAATKSIIIDRRTVVDEVYDQVQTANYERSPNLYFSFQTRPES